MAIQNDPPASPSKGDRYIVGSSPTGAWTGYATYIATYDGSAWIFDQPSEGWRAYDISADCDKLFNGTSWQEAGGGGLGYALSLVAGNLTPVSDGATYYWGGQAGIGPQTTAGRAVVYIPKAGTIKVAYIFMWPGTTGTPEEVYIYIRKNNTTDTLIGIADLSSGTYLVSSTALSISVAQGNYIEIKVVCPTFSTNPNNVRFSGVLYIE